MSCRIIEMANEAARNVPPGAGLSEIEHMALTVAYVNEQRAAVSSSAAVTRFGEVAPFDKLAQAGKRHAAALAKLMEVYGVDVPEGMWVSEEMAVAALPDDLEAACGQQAEAEAILARSLDERLIPAVAENPGLTALFTELRDAARDRHLPALLRSAGDTVRVHRAGYGHGHGVGHGHGPCCGGHHGHHGQAGHMQGHGAGAGHGQCCGGHGHGHGEGHGAGHGQGQGQGHGSGHGHGQCCGGHGHHAHGEGHGAGHGHGHGHGQGQPAAGQAQEAPVFDHPDSHQHHRCCGGEGRAHGQCKGH